MINTGIVLPDCGPAVRVKLSRVFEDLNVVPDWERFGVREVNERDNDADDYDCEERLERNPRHPVEIRIELIADECRCQPALGARGFDGGRRV